MRPQGINIEYVFQAFYELLTGGIASDEVVQRAITISYTVTYIVCVVLFCIIIYYVIKIHRLKHEDNLNFERLFQIAEAPQTRNPRWDSVVEHINSDNPAQWRIAILEADAMLDELLRTLGYHGEGIGEMLRQIERGDMMSLDAAWQAHKVRNKIAHEGFNFGLTAGEAQQTIALFKTVFDEFGAI